MVTQGPASPPGWAGVLGSSCPADSQQLVWCEQRFSDHLLAVGGAGSTPPWHAWGTCSHSCPGAADSHWLWAAELPEEPQNELLHSWKSTCSRICPCPASPPRPPSLFPHAHKPWRNRFGPCGQSSFHPLPSSTGRAGRAQHRGRSLALCCGGFWRFLLPVSQAWCHGAGGLLGPCPVPSSAAICTLVREQASSASSLSDLCSKHCCGAAQLCTCNQDHDGVI